MKSRTRPTIAQSKRQYNEFGVNVDVGALRPLYTSSKSDGLLTSLSVQYDDRFATDPYTRLNSTELTTDTVNEDSEYEPTADLLIERDLRNLLEEYITECDSGLAEYEVKFKKRLRPYARTKAFAGLSVNKYVLNVPQWYDEYLNYVFERLGTLPDDVELLEQSKAGTYSYPRNTSTSAYPVAGDKSLLFNAALAFKLLTAIYESLTSHNHFSSVTRQIIAIDSIDKFTDSGDVTSDFFRAFNDWFSDLMGLRRVDNSAWFKFFIIRGFARLQDVDPDKPMSGVYVSGNVVRDIDMGTHGDFVRKRAVYGNSFMLNIVFSLLEKWVKGYDVGYFEKQSIESYYANFKTSKHTHGGSFKSLADDIPAFDKNVAGSLIDHFLYKLSQESNSVLIKTWCVLFSNTPSIMSLEGGMSGVMKVERGLTSGWKWTNVMSNIVNGAASWQARRLSGRYSSDMFSVDWRSHVSEFFMGDDHMMFGHAESVDTFFLLRKSCLEEIGLGLETESISIYLSVYFDDPVGPYGFVARRIRSMLFDERKHITRTPEAYIIMVAKLLSFIDLDMYLVKKSSTYRRILLRYVEFITKAFPDTYSSDTITSVIALINASDLTRDKVRQVASNISSEIEEYVRKYKNSGALRELMFKAGGEDLFSYTPLIREVGSLSQIGLDNFHYHKQQLFT